MRKLMMAAVALAGLGLTAGCQSRNNEVQKEREDAAEAQTEARQEMTAAAEDFQREQAEAQENYQQQVGEAQQNVQEERQDVAQAQQEQQQQQAEQAQEDQEQLAESRQQVAEERQELSESQQELAQEQEAIGGSGMAAAEQTVTGSLTKASKDELSLRDANGKELQLKLDDTTQLTRNGQAVKADTLKEGTQVRASWTADGKDKKASKVEVLSPATK